MREPRTDPQSLPRGALVLTAALLLLSMAGLLLQAIPGCGGCQARHGPWEIVAPLGIVGYGVLLALGRSRQTWVYFFGVAAAAGVHSVFMGVMVFRGELCPICWAAGFLALVLFILVLRDRALPRLRLLGLGTVPALFLAAGLSSLGMAYDASLQREKERVIHRSRVESPPSAENSILTLEVFEKEDCMYCREFRHDFVPRLERDFPDRLRIHYQSAEATTWVRTTPTIVVGSGICFEGLPSSYRLLHDVIQEALSSEAKEAERSAVAADSPRPVRRSRDSCDGEGRRTSVSRNSLQWEP